MVDVKTTIQVCTAVGIACFALCIAFVILSFTNFVGYLFFGVFWAVAGLINIAVAGTYKHKASQNIKSSYK